MNPTQMKAILDRRDEIALLGKAAREERKRRSMAVDRSKEIELVTSDAWHFATNYIETIDEVQNEIRPFPSYPFLRDKVFPNVLNDGSKLWEKAQRMLITISFTIAFFWAWLTWDIFVGWMTSRKQDSVCNAGVTWKSLFGKMKFYYDRILRNGNGWLIEHYLGSVPESARLFTGGMALRNPMSGSTIIGEAPTADAGTGEGYRMALVDEAALVENLHTIFGNLRMACPNGTHLVSYPNGMGNIFAEVRHNEEKNHYGMKIMTVGYYDHPKHNEKTFKVDSSKLPDDDVGRRLLISYEISTRGKIIKNFSEKNIDSSFDFDPQQAILCFDFGSVDATSVGIINESYREVNGKRELVILIRSWLELWNTNYVEVANELHQMLMDLNFCEGKGKIYSSMADDEKEQWHKQTLGIKAVGDPQVRTRAVGTGITIHSNYRSAGFNIAASPIWESKAAYEEMEKWLADARILLHFEATEIADAFRFASWPVDRTGSITHTATQPKHDKYSHAFKSFEYYFRDLLKRGGGESVNREDIEKELADKISYSKQSVMGLEF